MKSFEFFKVVLKTKDSVEVFNPYTNSIVKMDWPNFNRQFKVNGIKAFPKNAFKESLDLAHNLIAEIANEIGNPCKELVDKMMIFMSIIGADMVQMETILCKEIKWQRKHQIK